jgi:hypothetical protein
LAGYQQQQLQLQLQQQQQQQQPSHHHASYGKDRPAVKLGAVATDRSGFGGHTDVCKGVRQKRKR